MLVEELPFAFILASPEARQNETDSEVIESPFLISLGVAFQLFLTNAGTDPRLASAVKKAKPEHLSHREVFLLTAHTFGCGTYDERHRFTFEGKVYG